MKRASSGVSLEYVRCCTLPPRFYLLTRCSSVPQPQSVAQSPNGLEGDRKVGTIERQELLNEAYDPGYSAGFEAGVRAEAAKHQNNPTETESTYAQGFAAGQRRLMDSEIAFAFARGQIAEQQRIRAYLDEAAIQIGQANKTPETSLEMAAEPPEAALRTTPLDESTQGPPAQQSGRHSSKDSYLSRTDSPIRSPEATVECDALEESPPYSRHIIPPASRYPKPTSQGTDGVRRRIVRPKLHLRHANSQHSVATCVFCGLELSQNSMLRHKRRHHAAELAAVGVTVEQFSCWWPGCGQFPYLDLNQLTTHLQRKHNFTPPGEPNAFTENIKYIKRFPTDLLISIIAEAAHQLNAVKLRIQDLEAQIRQRNPSYVSHHALPNVHILHESRQEVLSAILVNREQLPLILQELRQLTRARGLRSQIRSDEGTWWEVADDLEAGLDPSSKLAKAVVTLAPPGEGPTVHLNLNVLSDGPNMNHPAWRPKYALPLQAGWELKGPDENPVWVPPGAGAQINNPSAARPASFPPISAFQDDEDDKEEDDGYQKLMAEITSRVQQSDWDHSSNEDGDESGDAEEDAVQQHPTKREASQERKRPVATVASPGRTKRRRAA